MIWLLILVTKLIMMGFRAPDRATTSLTLLLNANVMKTSASLCSLNHEVYSSNDMELTAVHYLKPAGRGQETYATMMVGAGTGVYESKLTKKKTYVYMGNVAQRLVTDGHTTRFLGAHPDSQIYAFSPGSTPITVVHHKKTLLYLTNELGSSSAHAGAASSRMLDAGEHTPWTQLTSPWLGFIPRDSHVEAVVIKVTLTDKSTRQLTFKQGEYQELLQASDWIRFQVIYYQNSDGSCTDLQEHALLH